MMHSENGKYSRFVDSDRGLVSREIFSSEEVYRAELNNIFGRCWLYLAHESEIPNKGDFVNVLMGTEAVIVSRGMDNKIRAFLNSCRHRGNRVTRVDRGNAKTFTCSYHGWTFSTSGKLVGVPGAKELYYGDLDQEKWGLIPVAQTDSYKGLIFGTFDSEAPTLETYLGDMRWGLDLLLDQGELIAVPGIVRWSMDCNWKFASDNAVGDVYHGQWTHRSAMQAGHRGGNETTVNYQESLGEKMQRGFTVFTEYGHGFNADYMTDKVDLASPLARWRTDPVVTERLGEFRQSVLRTNQNVFPNLFVNSGSRDLILRVPVGPTRTEVWKTVLIDKNAAPEVQREQMRASNRHCGPAGMFEQEDGENWDQSTYGTKGPVARLHDLNYSMGLGHSKLVSDEKSPPRIDNLINEDAQRWLYRVWAEFMDAESWPELIKNHAKPEGVY